MVSNLRNLILIVFLLSFLFSCKNSGDTKRKLLRTVESSDYKSSITDTAAINGLYLELLNNNEQTVLQVIKGLDTIVLNTIKIKPPCYFLRTTNNGLASFSYPDVNVNETIIIVGDLTTDEEKRDVGLSDYKNICGNTIQGVLFKDNNTIVLSKNTITGTSTCVDISVDEKVFWSFAHD